MRRLRSTILLVLLFAGIGAYAYFVTSKKPAPDAPPTKDRVFKGVDADAITNLTVKADAGDTTTLKKENGVWKMVAPLQTDGDSDDLMQITSNLSTLEINRTVEDNPTDLNQYHLQTPRIEIDFTAGKDMHRLYIGEKTPTNGDLFARRDDDKKVYLIGGFTEAIFNRTTFDLRDKKLVSVDPEKVGGMTLDSDGKTVQMTKTGEDWALAKPISLPGDNGNIDMFLSRVKTVAMKSMVAEQGSPADLKKDGFDKPQGSITLDAGDKHQTLVVGGKMDDSSLYIRDAAKPWIATVDASFLKELQKGTDDFRRRALFEFKGFDADRLELTKDGQTYVFERVKSQGQAPDKWHRTAPTAGDPDAAKMETLLAKLENLRALDFVPSTTKTGLDKPTLAVSAKYQDGKKEEHVSFAKGDDIVYASRMGEPGIAKVATAEFDDTVKALDGVAK